MREGMIHQIRVNSLLDTRRHGLLPLIEHQEVSEAFLGEAQLVLGGFKVLDHFPHLVKGNYFLLLLLHKLSE